MRHVSTGLMLFLGITLFLAVTYAGCSAFLKNNGAYERGVATALADPVILGALGAPAEESWFINGAVEGNGMSTRGSWSVRLRGVDEAGTLYIEGAQASGEWRVVSLTFKVAGERYDYIVQQGFRKAKPGTSGPGPSDITGALD